MATTLGIDYVPVSGTLVTTRTVVFTCPQTVAYSLVSVTVSNDNATQEGVTLECDRSGGSTIKLLPGQTGCATSTFTYTLEAFWITPGDTIILSGSTATGMDYNLNLRRLP